MQLTKRFLLIATALLITMALTQAPAAADRRGFADASADAHPRGDLVRVVVRNTQESVTVVARYAKLRKKDKHHHDLAVWIDTPGPKRPDFLLGAGGYHTYFGSTRGWRLRTSNEHPFGDVMCNVGYRYKPKKDRIRFRFASSCIGSPKKIRVAVTHDFRTYDEDGQEVLHSDHLVSLHALTGWVRR